MTAKPANGAYQSSSEIVGAPGGVPVRVETVVRPGLPDARTILMVNGALASSRSYRWAVEALPDLNLVLYDLPHADPAASHAAGRALTTAEEVAILDFLIERHRPACLGSMSWGGATALFALARNPPSVEKAVLCSFADHAGPPLKALLGSFIALVAARRYEEGAALLAQTLAARLPDKLKLANRAYLTSLGEGARAYILHHMEAMLELDVRRFDAELSGIGAEILFLNGADDLYAPVADAARLAQRLPRAQSAALPDCGHFLALEGAAQAMVLAGHLRRFLGPAAGGRETAQPGLAARAP